MIKVMIIEDDPMVQMIIEGFVQKIDGYNILALASDIGEAKVFLENNEVDLILLDVFLPSGLGLDLLKWIREKEIQCDVILITAENSSTSIKEAFRLGAIDYLVKPFIFQRFKDSLENFRNRWEDLSNKERVTQDEIDQYMMGINSDKEEILNENVEGVVKLAKGLNNNTYNKIYSYIKMKDEEVTADFIANETGLARVTVRRYLDYMVKEGKVTLIQTYGKIGRPTHYYKKK